MKILYLITARGNSKGVPKKNIKKIGELTLIEYKACAAKRSKYCNRLILSSDDADIIALAKDHDIEVPFVRPAELATDTATSFDVISHAIDYLESQGDYFDAIMLLEPSSPFSRPDDLNKSVEIYKEKKAELVVSVVKHKVHPKYIGQMDGSGSFSSVINNVKSLQNTNRQSLPDQYIMNGCVYLFSWEGFKVNKTLYYNPNKSFGFEMDPIYSIEIDEPIDLEWARYLVKTGKINLNHWM